MSLMSKVNNLEQRALQFQKAAANVASTATDHTTRKGQGALRDRPISVGSGNDRSRAQSGQESSKGILASLSRGLNSLINSAMGLFKNLHAYLFESSDPEAPLQPKDLMSRALQDAKNDAKTLWNDLNSSEPSNPAEDLGRWFNKNVGRPLERMMEPEPSWLEKKFQRAQDFVQDNILR